MNKYASNVWITGVGTVTPFGNTLDDVFHNIVDVEAINQDGIIKEESDLHNRTSYEHFYDMLTKAIENAIEDYGGKDRLSSGATLVIGSGLGLTDALGEENVDSENFLSEVEMRIKERYTFIKKVFYFSNACAASSQAICYGADLIGYGKEDIVIVGGIDIYSNIAKAGFERLCSLDKTGCHPFDENRNGISVGEGAAFFVLEAAPVHKNYGRILGYGSTNDAYDIVRMDKEGTQIVRAMEQALDMADCNKEIIDAVIAHGTGTRLNDKVEAEQIQHFFKDCKKLPYVTAPKGMFGHTGGSSGSISLLCALGILKNQIIPAISGLVNLDTSVTIQVVCKKSIQKEVDYLLVNCFAFGGSNVVILVGR